MPPPAPAPGRTASPPSVAVAHSRSVVSRASRVDRSAPLPAGEAVRRAGVAHQRRVGRGRRDQLDPADQGPGRRRARRGRRPGRARRRWWPCRRRRRRRGAAPVPTRRGQQLAHALGRRPGRGRGRPAPPGAARPPRRPRRTPSPSATRTRAGTGSPSGPCTVTTASSPPRAGCSTSRKPGPPSESGSRSTTSYGALLAHPSAIASAASAAVSDRAPSSGCSDRSNRSGATSTRMPGSCPIRADRRGAAAPGPSAGPYDRHPEDRVRRPGS